MSMLRLPPGALRTVHPLVQTVPSYMPRLGKASRRFGQPTIRMYCFRRNGRGPMSEFSSHSAQGCFILCCAPFIPAHPYPNPPAQGEGANKPSLLAGEGGVGGLGNEEAESAGRRKPPWPGPIAPYLPYLNSLSARDRLVFLFSSGNIGPSARSYGRDGSPNRTHPGLTPL